MKTPRTSLKSLVAAETPSAPPAQPVKAPSSPVARTRENTRQVGGHFAPEVAQALRLIAVEENRDIQEIIGEALNMVFTRYGKTTRAVVVSGRRR